MWQLKNFENRRGSWTGSRLLNSWGYSVTKALIISYKVVQWQGPQYSPKADYNNVCGDQLSPSIERGRAITELVGRQGPG